MDDYTISNSERFLFNKALSSRTNHIENLRSCNLDSKNNLCLMFDWHKESVEDLHKVDVLLGVLNDCAPNIELYGASFSGIKYHALGVTFSFNITDRNINNSVTYLIFLFENMLKEDLMLA